MSEQGVLLNATALPAEAKPRGVSCFGRRLGEQHLGLATTLDTLAPLSQATHWLAPAERRSRRSIRIFFALTGSADDEPPFFRQAWQPRPWPGEARIHMR